MNGTYARCADWIPAVMEYGRTWASKGSYARMTLYLLLGGEWVHSYKWGYNFPNMGYGL